MSAKEAPVDGGGAGRRVCGGCTCGRAHACGRTGAAETLPSLAEDSRPMWVRSPELCEKELCLRVLKENISILNCTFLGTALSSYLQIAVKLQSLR